MRLGAQRVLGQTRDPTNPPSQQPTGTGEGRGSKQWRGWFVFLSFLLRALLGNGALLLIGVFHPKVMNPPINQPGVKKSGVFHQGNH